MKEKKTIKVEGMSCSHCENANKKAVGDLPGVESVTVDLNGRSVTTVFNNEKTSLSRISAVIDEQGYNVV